MTFETALIHRTAKRALWLITIIAGLSGTVQSFAGDVKMGGYTIEHTHHQASERRISPENVGGLQKKWEHVTCGTVDSTPAIVDDVIYVTDRGGCVHKLDRQGRPLWSEPRRIPEPPYTADMYALDAKTGRILWTFKSGASVGGAPAIADGLVVWGTGYPRSGVAPRIQRNRVFGFELPRVRPDDERGPAKPRAER